MCGPTSSIPTKWALRALATVGLAHNLRRTPPPAIVRARLHMDERRLQSLVPPAARERLAQLRAAVDRAVTRWHDLVAQYESMKRQASNQARDAMINLRAEIRTAGRDWQTTYACWKWVVRSPETALILWA